MLRRSAQVFLTINLAFIGLFSITLFIAPQSVLAEPAATTTDPAQTAERLARISAGCTSIKQSLTQLQHADSRTRTYLGSSYETVANNFISPINLRLVRNNRPAPDIMNIQSEFSIAQTAFRNQYTTYMRSLEALIATDCRNHPEEFAAHLDTARTNRAALHEITNRLSQLISEQQTVIRKLQEDLYD